MTNGHARALALPVLARSLCAALVLLTPACDPGDAGPEATQTVLEVTDSAGVKTVLLGNLDELAATRITPDLVASTREQGIELFNATMALFLDGGGLAVANAGAMEVLLLADDGSLARRVGRQGEGPGEFMEVTSLVRTPAGFLVYDARLGRINEFTGEGDFVTSRTLSSESRVADLKPLAQSTSGEMLAILGALRLFSTRDEVRRDITPLLVFRDSEAAPDTLALLPAREWSYSVSDGISFRNEMAFGRDAVAFGLEDRAIIGDTDSLDLSVHLADGRVTRRIRGNAGERRISADEMRAWKDEELAELGSDPPEPLVRAIEEIHTETYPAFSTALLGPDEMVWIGLQSRWGDEERMWLIVDPDGQLRGSIQLPAEARVLAVDARRFAVQRRDDLDVEDIRVYTY
ncbi:MAG: hypothetical protein F4Y07_15505 [Gemmatimonadetes bacterium]|nr:hypothetical protein [Gemmatimonadota bacterium]MYE17876.1 hypothetical protein [Gemmatimonadota bacterium]MYG21343.1 hypothetical protein [Gemmatimonadota bacterium]MYJ40715.1 hypothetical protein [Gemmatimonadota bacterium]